MLFSEKKRRARRVQAFLCALFAAVLLAGAGGCGGKSAQGAGDIYELVELPEGLSPDKKCNLHEELCGRRYDQVVYAMTHNSMSNRAEGWDFANQMYGITRQLNDGIRGINLDIHYDDGQVYLCHGYCNVGRELLSTGLAKIEFFLKYHPDEVVTIIFESYVSAEDVKAAFEESGLLKRVYAHRAGQPWPILREMILKDRRVVVFTDHEGGAYDWYHAVWDYAWETKYSYKTTDDFECGPNRGNPNNDLYIINHFLTNPLASTYLAEDANYNPLFIDRVKECMAEKGRTPNFILVDFYDIGDLLEVVDTLNGVATDEASRPFPGIPASPASIF